jgi:integrase
MAGKRDFGALRRLPSGHWQVRYRLPTGERITAPLTFRTRADANAWLSQLETEMRRGIWVDPRAGQVRLDDYAQAWLNGMSMLAPRTREIYASQLNLHILPAVDPGVPALGELAIGEITSELVRVWHASLVKARTRSVAAKAYVRLRQILGQAVKDDRLAKNPCRIDRGGLERHSEQRFINLGQLYQLADAIEPRYRALVLTAGLTGLRQGELFALRRRDLDLAGGWIHVRRKRIRLASGEVIEDEPKTEAGLRRVAVGQRLGDELRHHVRAYTPKGLEAYVFTTGTGLPLDRNNFRQRTWEPATAKTGLGGLRFHDMRHTAGTLAAQTGASTKELMARLGHASPRASLIYQHAAEERERRIADQLDQLTEALAPIIPIRPAAEAD